MENAITEMVEAVVTQSVLELEKEHIKDDNVNKMIEVHSNIVLESDHDDNEGDDSKVDVNDLLTTYGNIYIMKT